MWGDGRGYLTLHKIIRENPPPKKKKNRMRGRLQAGSESQRERFSRRFRDGWWVCGWCDPS